MALLVPAGACEQERKNSIEFKLEEGGGGLQVPQQYPGRARSASRVSRVTLLSRRRESLAFHRDPFNRPELVHTLRGRELLVFVVLYAIGVVAIVFMFESVMPVFWVDDSTRAENRRRAAIVFTPVKMVLRDEKLSG